MKLTKRTILACPNCGKEVRNCDGCGHQIAEHDEMGCRPMNFGEYRHYHLGCGHEEK